MNSVYERVELPVQGNASESFGKSEHQCDWKHTTREVGAFGNWTLSTLLIMHLPSWSIRTIALGWKCKTASTTSHIVTAINGQPLLDTEQQSLPLPHLWCV